MKIRNKYLKKFIMINKTYKDNYMFANNKNNFSFQVTIFLNKYK